MIVKKYVCPFKALLQYTTLISNLLKPSHIPYVKRLKFSQQQYIIRGVPVDQYSCKAWQFVRWLSTYFIVGIFLIC